MKKGSREKPFLMETMNLEPEQMDHLRALIEGFLREGASLIRSLDPLALFQAGEVDEFGRDLQFEKKVQPFFSFLYEKYWRVEVDGADRIPSRGPVLFVANHSGTLPYDAAMIKMAAKENNKGRDLRFLVEDFVYHFPFLGMLMYRIGGVRACQENAERLLKQGEAVLCFPEGAKGIGKLYKDRYRLQRFGRGGFIRLCMRSKATIVPVAVVGAEEIHPILFKMDWFARLVGLPYLPVTPTFPLLGPLGVAPLPTKWKITFGQPVAFDSYSPAQMDDPILVNRLAEGVRQKIQSMIADLLKKRTSIW